MATDLYLHNIDHDLVIALTERAAQHGRSLEEEHREILKLALRRPSRPDPLQVIAEARALRATLPQGTFYAADIDALKRAGRK